MRVSYRSGTISDLSEVKLYFLSHGATARSGSGPHYRGFTITLCHTTLITSSLDEWSALCKDLRLTSHNTHKKQTSMPPAGFEPAIPASERPQTHALDRAATGMCDELHRFSKLDAVEVPHPCSYRKIKCSFFYGGMGAFVGVKLFKGIKVNFTPDQAMKAQRGSWGIALFFL